MTHPQLLGNALPLGPGSPVGSVELDINRLREEIRDALQVDDYLPA